MATFFVSTASVPAPRTPFSALLLGYTAAPRADVQGYADALHAAGAALVAYSTPTLLQLALGETYTSTVPAAAAQALAQRSDLPVLLLLLSDGGCVCYRVLHRVLWGEPGSTCALLPLPEPLAQLRSRIVGVAFDSAPSPNRAAVTGPALASIAARGSALRYALAWAPCVLGATLQMSLLCAGRGADWPLPRLGPAAALPSVPHLFLWGALDPLVPQEHLQKVLAARRAALDGGEGEGKGLPSRVTLVAFKGASHLQLLALFEAVPGHHLHLAPSGPATGCRAGCG